MDIDDTELEDFDGDTEQITIKDDTEWLDINGYHVRHSKYDGYAAYDGDDTIFQIKPDGTTEIRTKCAGMTEWFDGLTIDDIKPNSVFKGPTGMEYYFSGDAITSAKGYNIEDDAYWESIYNDDKCITKIYDQEGGKLYGELINNSDGCTSYKDYENNITNYFNEHVDLYCVESPDGTKKYLDGEEVLLITYPDGTYKKGDKKGLYTLDNNGNIVCSDKEGNQIIYDRFGYLSCIIDKNGREILYYTKTDTQSETKNGKTIFSKINHIEYDEDAYDKILNTLNSVNSSNITSNCTVVTTNINSFPDSGYSSNISNIEKDISDHVKLVKSLSSMTNYSLLAYQTCDEELRKGLYLLIDSLFGDNELGLGEKFKSAIKGLIEDNDNDKILEYREDTNFKVLSDNAIVSQIITDENGNKWYLNKNNYVVGLEGKNIKINYGGESFNLSYDKNGVIKLTDSNGNPINIFGDYNLESKQFGGNQGDLINAYNDLNMASMVRSYYPYVMEEDLTDLLKQAALTGCGYTAMTNLVFKKFEGKEDEFYSTFGYPMYDIKYDPKNGASVNYNYEPMIMDMYCHVNNDDHESIDYTTYSGHGTSTDDIAIIEKYLKDKYNVTLDGYNKPHKFYAEHNYTLYNMDETVYGNLNNKLKDLEDEYGFDDDDNDYHAMLGVDETNDGRPIVSTWGEKLILEQSTDPEDVSYSEQYYHEYK